MPQSLWKGSAFPANISTQQAATPPEAQPQNHFSGRRKAIGFPQGLRQSRFVFANHSGGLWQAAVLTKPVAVPTQVDSA
jgi:hypothetical protein